MSDGLKLHYSNPKFDGKPWAIDGTRKRRKSARNITPSTLKPYLGDRPAAVKAHGRRERDAWLTLADRHLAAGKTVTLESPAVQSSLAKENRRAHELHVRRIEKIKQKYGS